MMGQKELIAEKLTDLTIELDQRSIFEVLVKFKWNGGKEFIPALNAQYSAKLNEHSLFKILGNLRLQSLQCDQDLIPYDAKS